jgi:hypothetical protein
LDGPCGMAFLRSLGDILPLFFLRSRPSKVYCIEIVSFQPARE